MIKAFLERCEHCAEFNLSSHTDFTKASQIISVHINKIGNSNQKNSEFNDETSKPIYEYFLMEEYEDHEKGAENLLEICIIYNVNMFQYLKAEIMMYQAMQNAFFKLLKIESKDYATADTILDIVFENSIKYMSSEKTAKKDFNKIPNEFKSAMLKISYAEATQKLKNEKYNTQVNIDKHMNNIDIHDDIQHHYEIIKDTFSNKKIASKVHANHNPHFFHKLYNSEIAYSEDKGMVYFKDLTDSLVIGYSQKAFLIGIDKSKAIRELRTKVKHLKDYNLQGSKELITYTENLINLIEQKKHSDKIPFKTVGKALGMTKNEAKNYAKKIMQSVNDNAFKSFYSDDTKT